ncbi:MAG TPA: pyridoxal phosphate-dependent aminotransferase, partial [Vicinamibacterales bacterium]|nr:pyridoxal phosphate-dependent aminotransferase [Vicinamibacterales bacterium]
PAGDGVLVPAPSYPLFEHLTRLDGVRAWPYRLEYHGRWALDPGSLDRVWSDSVRAVLAVSPNNPTGSVLTGAELEEVACRCLERGAALIIDEVFADYPLAVPQMGDPGAGPPAGASDPCPPCLTFRLGGLSKSAGLPQVKLAWIAVQGPDGLASEAMERLELMCDTYLSVSTPVQIAAPSLIASGASIRTQIQDRVRTNYHGLRALASGYPGIEVLNAEAGWSAVVRVPATRAEEEIVLGLIERAAVLVHPGFFFDFPHEAFLVLSLLSDPRAFSEGARRVVEYAVA